MMIRGRTSHKKIAATAARFAREAEAVAKPAPLKIAKGAAYYRDKLALPFLSPRDRRHYERELAKAEATERDRERVRAALEQEPAP